MPETGASKRWH